ncbi:MAG: energy transducer TonB, partial [Flavobacteriaceae bacterium]|nr:energy transducer TonB [Flavobacteriaceae bacterium]
MAFLQTTYEKKSFWTTAFILLAVLLLLFFAGLRYLDPPPENGILIAFGN